MEIYINKLANVLSIVAVAILLCTVTISCGDNDDELSSDEQEIVEDNNNGKDEFSDIEIPYNNYVVYSSKYSNRIYIHEIKKAKCGITYGNSSNEKYLRFYYDDSYEICAIQLESYYLSDEMPSSSIWSAGKYQIDNSETNKITHLPIARVYIYDNNFKRISWDFALGTAKIAYSGKVMTFDFNGADCDNSFNILFHFEGTYVSN